MRRSPNDIWPFAAFLGNQFAVRPLFRALTCLAVILLPMVGAVLPGAASAADLPHYAAVQAGASIQASVAEQPPAQASPVLVGTITDDGVNMRTGPGTSYAVRAQLPADMKAEVLGQEAGWYHILTPWQADGWVVGDYFQPISDTSGGANLQRIGTAATVGTVNLRSGPGTSYSSYGLMDDSTVLDVLALQGAWYKVRSPRGTVGWVSSDYVPLDWIPGVYGGSGTPSGSSSSDIVAIAQKYLGARYVWGGSNPSGFDCSGLAWYVYRKVGVWLPAGTFNQYSRKYGRYIGDISALAPGDLVFFEGTSEDGGITHEGIYAGDGKMIAARSERLGVRYVSLSEPFWSSRFVGGIRPYR